MGKEIARLCAVKILLVLKKTQGPWIPRISPKISEEIKLGLATIKITSHVDKGVLYEIFL